MATSAEPPAATGPKSTAGPTPEPPATPPAPAPVDLSEESVAGEEDPGAALDIDEIPPVTPAEPDSKPPVEREPKPPGT